MSGFATCEGILSGRSVRIELRSLNHRSLDIRLRLPREYVGLEPRIKTLIQEQLSRGAVDLKIENQTSTANPGTDEVLFEANLALAASYYEALTGIKKNFGIADPITLRDLATAPGIISRTAQPGLTLDVEALWQELSPLLLNALGLLKRARGDEGRQIRDKLSDGQRTIQSRVKTLRAQRETWLEQNKIRLKERLKTIFESAALDSHLDLRLSQEIALIAERTDFEEELNRLDGHIQALEQTIAHPGPSGRRTEFILQELAREANTIGSKCQDVTLAAEAIEIKLIIEQMREQALNLE